MRFLIFCDLKEAATLIGVTHSLLKSHLMVCVGYLICVATNFQLASVMALWFFLVDSVKIEVLTIGITC